MNKREAGRLGGIATASKHGSDHMREIGKLGAHAMHSKYNLTPYGMSDFAIVSKETGEIVALLSGRKVAS